MGLINFFKKERQKYHNKVLNKIQIKQMIKIGDNPKKDRLIDHALLFATKEDRKNYLDELLKLKFPFEKYKLFDDQHTLIHKPFVLELTVISPVQEKLLNRTTDILITLAEKYNATYDGWGAEVKK